MDWEQFMGLEPEALSEQEKEDLYEMVIGFNADDNLSKKDLIHFIRIMQEILKFKSDQLEYLTNELDKMAMKQGTEECNKLQQFRDEIKHLREELDWYQKQDKGNGANKNFSPSEDLRQRLLMLQNQNEVLLGELSEKEKDLVLEKKEVEKCLGILAALEREKQELTRELKILKDEGTEKSLRSLKNSPDSEEEKYEVLLETIKQKNKHISALLKDIETVEEENSILRSNISAIKVELKETTANISEITEELSKFKHLSMEYESKEIGLKAKINSLMNQIEELVEEKEKHNIQLDEYVSAFNVKVQEWKEIVESKDGEIMTLKEEIKNFYNSANAVSIAEVGDVNLNKIIQRQHEQIHILQEELQRATEEINTSTELIEKLKEKQIKLTPLPKSDTSEINFFEEKIRILEDKLKYAEDDARLKAEESSTLIVQLREYESKVFGLSEAVAKIKKLENNIQKKDLQSEKLIDACNELELKLNCLEEQNLALREKLGLSPVDVIDTSIITLRFKKNEEMICDLEEKLQKKEEELIQVKLMYRKVAAEVETLRCIESNLNDSKKVDESKVLKKAKETEKKEDSDVKINYILEENDALRKGMHEILESIRNQNCLGNVQVQSNCLERLLEALDSRHVSGWYHPAMRLQAQLNAIEGKNDELRNQIRFLKAEGRKKASELQNAYLKIKSLEKDTMVPHLEGNQGESAATQEFEDIKVEGRKCSIDIDQEKKLLETESKLCKLKVLFENKMIDIENKERSFVEVQEELLSTIDGLKGQVNMLKKENPEMKDLMELTEQNIVLNRKMHYLKNLESEHVENIEKLKREFLDEEEKMLLVILKLQNEKVELLNEIEEMEKNLTDTVSMDKFTSVKKELESITTKYKCAISLSLLSEDAKSSEYLNNEISLLEGEKQQLNEELKNTKEKLIMAEALIKEETVPKGDFGNEISCLASKLAACETRELNENQKSKHLDKINEVLKSQLKELENRNNELLEKVVKLTEECFKYQEVEGELREQVMKLFPLEESRDSQEKIEILERRIREVITERDNIQELFEISQSQCRAFQQWKKEDKILLTAQKEEILLLQASNENKASISKLSHELAISKLKSSELIEKNRDLKMKLTKLLAQNLNLENKISENRSEFIKSKKKHLNQIGFLYKIMNDVRSLYGCPVTFRRLENISKKKLELRESSKKATEQADNLKVLSEEYILKKNEMETQMKSLEDLKIALKGDAKNLMSWYNKSTALRLREAKCRRKNELLLDEVTQLKNCIERLNEEIATLEEEHLEREKYWEQRESFWEESQLYVCQLLRENGFEENCFPVNIKDSSHPTTNFEDNVSSEKHEEKAEEMIPEKIESSEKWTDQEEKEECLEEIGEKNISDKLEESCCTNEMEDAEKEALKMTIDSLQSVIKQKEETIVRFQGLLKEEREECRLSCSKLEEEVRALNEALNVQNKAYSKLKSATNVNNFSAENVSMLVEKYITTIQELEEKVRMYQLNLSTVNAQAQLNQQEVEKWHALAAERLSELEETKRRYENRVNEDCKIELENCKKEIRNYESEVERLARLLEYQRSDLSLKYRNDKEYFQEKKETAEREIIVKPIEENKKQSSDELETLQKQLKLEKNESARLREQIQVLSSRARKWPKSGGSSTVRADSKTSAEKESLTSKIKNLEELLTASREKEKELMELSDKKLKSIEEVARWEERKRNEQLIRNLNAKVREKEAEVEMLNKKNDSFRNLVHKCEKDKEILKSQFKVLKGKSEETNALIEKLKIEKKKVEDEANALKMELEEGRKYSSGVGTALLHEKLEAQERKLMAYELASKSGNAVVEDLEKLQMLNSKLEKLNLKLEGENLSLRLKLEKEKLDGRHLKENANHFHENKCCHFQKCFCSANDKKKQLDADEGVQRNQKDREIVLGESFEIKKNFEKFKEDYKFLNQKYLEALNKNIALEDEVKRLKNQIYLLEQKGFVQSFHGIMQNPNDLSQEMEELKNQLTHKNQLLCRVKILLMKAAAREKALLKKDSLLKSSSFQLPSEILDG